MDYYTVEEFAYVVQMNPQTIRTSIRVGKIHAIRVGIGKKSPYRIPASELVRLNQVSFDERIPHLKEYIEEREKSIKA